MSKANARIKTIITQLLAKARSTDNEHEADAFMAKAEELLRTYQLDAADLVDEDDPIIHHTGLKHAESGHAWRWKLYSAVAQLYGCKSIHVDIGYMKDEDGNYLRGRNGRFVPGYEQRLVGRESAIITTDLMYPWICQQVRAKARDLAKITGMSEQGQAKRIAAALISRIYKLIAEQREAAPTTPSGRNALVILNQVVAKYEELYPPHTTETMKGGRSVTDGLARNAANSIGLHRQTSGASQLKLGSK